MKCHGISDLYNDLKFTVILQKGFPTDSTLDDIKEWLEGKGPVESIQMRRTLQKAFKVAIPYKAWCSVICEHWEVTRKHLIYQFDS